VTQSDVGSGFRDWHRPALARWSERIAATALLVGVYVAVYFAAGLRPVAGASLGIPLDHWIPFHAAAVYVYASAYPMVLGPLFLVRDPDLFRRTWLGYALCIGVCGVFFVAWPVGSAAIRVDPSSIAPGTFSIWGVHLLYALDPPRNCFPSLHLALAATGALAVARASRAAGAIAVAWLAALAVSVLVVKQHYVVDAAAGIALGFTAQRLFVRGWRPSGADPSTGVRGGLALGAFVAAVFAAAYMAYAAGLGQPAPIW
jgi:membrane-associated phospholipid phosphatase